MILAFAGTNVDVKECNDKEGFITDPLCQFDIKSTLRKKC